MRGVGWHSEGVPPSVSDWGRGLHGETTTWSWSEGGSAWGTFLEILDHPYDPIHFSLTL